MSIWATVWSVDIPDRDEMGEMGYPLTNPGAPGGLHISTSGWSDLIRVGMIEPGGRSRSDSVFITADEARQFAAALLNVVSPPSTDGPSKGWGGEPGDTLGIWSA